MFRPIVVMGRGGGFVAKASSVRTEPLARRTATRTQLGIETRTEFAPFVTKHWDGAQNDKGAPYEHTPDVDTHDGLGRLVSHASTLGGKSLGATFAYDAAGSLLQKTDPEGNVSRYTYDGRGRRTLVDDPDTGKQGFVYDVASSIIEHRRPDGVSERFTYDLAGRDLTSDWDGDGKPEVTFQWDRGDGDSNPILLGTLVKVTDPSGSTVNEYDERGRHTKHHHVIDGAHYDLASAYDAQDREYWRQYPDGSSIRIYRNPRGLVSAYGQAVTFDYDGDGVELRRSFNTGVIEERGYDDDRRLVEKRAKRSDATVLQDLQWALDGAGNLLSVTDARPGVMPDKTRSETYGYDNLYRLTGVKGAWGQAAWGYSPSGTLTSRSSSVPELQATGIAVGQGAGPHAITSINGRTIKYDAQGRMTDDGDRQYTFDAADHLVHVQNRAGASVDNVYDAAGTRRVRTEKGADGTHVTHFIDDSCESRDGTLVRYVTHGGVRIARLSPDNGVTAPAPKGGCASAPSRGGDLATLAVLLAVAGAFVARARRRLATFAASVAVGLVLLACSSGQAAAAPPVLDGSIQTLTDADHLLLDDAIGSLSEELTGTGSPHATFAAYPYGLKRYGTSAETRVYANNPRDEGVGLDSMGAREYAPDLGIWTSADPLVGSKPEVGVGDRFAAHNPYAYASDTPVLAVDRDGHFWHVVAGTLTGAAIGAVINGGSEVAAQLATTGKVSDWSKVQAKASVGAVAGAAEGGALALGVPAPAAGAAAGMTLGMGNRYIDSQGKTFGSGAEILFDGAVGAASAGFGSALSKGSKALPEARQAAQIAAKREAAEAVSKTSRDAAGRLRNPNGTFAFDGGRQQPRSNGTHGNTAGSQRAVLYERYDAEGNFLKHGISQDPSKRYTQGELKGGYLIEKEAGPRNEILKRERELVETNPGPLNKEPWAGKRKQ